MKSKRRFNRFEPNPYSTHHILGIGIGTAASLAVGVGSSLAGGMMQGGGASDAAGTMQGASLETQKMYQDAQRQNDAMLADAEARNQKAYKPWTRLGGQATRGLSRYLGYVPAYGVKKPANLTGAQLRTQWDKAHPGMKPKKGFEAKALKKQKNALAQWEAGRAAFDAQQRGTEDFGGYFEDYGVEEPKYKEFTRADLDADPIYQTELDENVRAWDQSAASRGSLMSGNTVAGLREITAGGIGRGRDRHIQDYGIGHDEWEGGYERDWNQRERKYNALTGMSNMGMQVADRRSNLRTGTAQGRIQNSQWGTQGAAGAEMSAADAAASGQLSQGNAYGNAFNNVGQMALLYGMGAFDQDHGMAGSPRRY